MKELRTKRVSFSLTPGDYEELLIIAKNEMRLPGSLIRWWTGECVEAYHKTDARGRAVVWARQKVSNIGKDLKEAMPESPGKILQFPVRGGTA